MRLSTAFFGALGTAVGAVLYLKYRNQSGTILDIWWQYAGAAGGGLFGLFLLAWLMPRLPNWAAVNAILASVAVTAWRHGHRPLSRSAVDFPAPASPLSYGTVPVRGWPTPVLIRP